MRKFFIVILLVFNTACSPSAALPEITATNTEIVPTATPAPTETPAPTNTPEATLTPTSMPQVLKDQILQSYKILMFVQLDANMLNQMAEKVKSGELAGFESFGALIGVAALVNAVDEAIPATTIPDIMRAYWEQSLPVHESTKSILARWYNKEIDSSTVVEEAAPLIAQADNIMKILDEVMEFQYGFDADELNKIRQDAIEDMNEIFTSSTSTPQP